MPRVRPHSFHIDDQLEIGNWRKPNEADKKLIGMFQLLAKRSLNCLITNARRYF